MPLESMLDASLLDSGETVPPHAYPHRKRSASRRLTQHLYVVMSCVILGVATLIAGCINWQATVCATPGSPTRPSIVVDATRISGHVSPLMFGQDLYYLDAAQAIYADPAQTTYDTSLLKYVREMSPTILRCGGGLDSEWYHWVSGIGPLASRVPVKMGKSPTVRVDNFGVDDCLRYAETIGATGLMQVDTNDYPVSSLNLWNPQATPKEAAALVAYVNGSPSDTRSIGVDEHGADWKTVGYWAQRRADNGHPAPYKVTYFEVGNEDYSFSGQNGYQYGQRFLLFAHAMKAVDPTIKTGAVLYNDEPQMNWNTQVPLVAKSEIDFTIDHDYPMGDTFMRRVFDPTTLTRTVDFPVVAGKTYTIELKAISWYAGKTDAHMVFTIDNHSFSVDIPREYSNYARIPITIPGSSLFSGGYHTITIQLTQISRYVDIYKDITVNGTPHPLFTDEEIYSNLLTTLERVDTYIDGLQTTVQNAGLPASVPLFVTEYNLAFSPTTEIPTYAASMIDGLLLMKYVQLGVGMASNFVLTQPMPQHWNVIASDVSNPNARLHWRNPQAYGFEIVRLHTGSTLLYDTIANNPTNSAGFPSLNILATKDRATDMLHLVISNSSYDQAVATNVDIVHGKPAGPVTVTTLNAPSLMSTSSGPDKSDISTSSTIVNGLSANATYVFPAHSITAIDIPLSPRSAPTPLPSETGAAIATPVPALPRSSDSSSIVCGILR